MKKTTLLTSVVFLCALSPIPAMAAMDSLGTIDVASRQDRDVVYASFGGTVESIQLRASDSSINCRSVVAKFGNGRTRQVYSGHLMEGRAVNVDLPGNDRRLTSLTFSCRADERWGGRVRILADVGRHQDEWRKSPDWNRLYSNLFSWGNTASDRYDGNNGRGPQGNRGANRSNAPDNWIQIGTERFEGNRDREAISTGWAGRNVEAIALMPTDANARCSRITANFRQGRDQDLAVSNNTVLAKGRYSKIDLPGNRRDLVSLKLNCRADRAKNVTIRVYTTR